jgi:sterol desaturase/sphingolipid hydroxylase (fatty acid hydroxylase superfamily)
MFSILKNICFNYIPINLSLISISSAICFAKKVCNDLFVFPFFQTLKSFLMIEIMKKRTEKKEKISKKESQITNLEYVKYTITTSCLKGATHYYILANILPNTLDILEIYDQNTILVRFLIFIIKSFASEILFDLFHYLGHRLLHSNKFVYKNIHKTHHKFSNPSARTSLYMSPIDVMLSYSLPLILTFSILPMKYSEFEFFMFTTYLTYQEIGGHLGKKMRPTSSFAQFIWIPRMLNIELYTEDHDLHHRKLNCNYGKRLSLWDKFFGTYQISDLDTNF